MSIFDRGAWLGMATLVTGHSEFHGTGPIRTYNPFAQAPFFGLWYAFSPDGDMIDSGRVGPFPTVEAAVQAARTEAAGAGVLEIGRDGWIRVVDKTGYSVGPVSE